MGLSVWFFVVVLLTTGECIPTVKAQDDSLPVDPEASGSPADSTPGDSVPAASIPPDSSPSSPANSIPTDGSPADNASPETSPVDSAPVDTSPANSSSTDTETFPPESSPPDTYPSISTTNPPAVFVFGDSLVDPGNNNYIPSLAKANIAYNGIDFHGGATGRFCNGRTVIDIVCDILGVPYPGPFLDPKTTGSRILRGVNYASGAAGILDATGANFLDRLRMNQQINSFQETTLPQLTELLGTNLTTTLLASSLVSIVIGSNDYINNYLLVESMQAQYTPAQFNVLLANAFRKQLMELYGFGFRMFFVSGLGPLGCIPHQLAKSGQPNCVSSVNSQVLDYNVLITSMLQGLNNELPEAMFLFGDSYTSLTNLINNPTKYGFTVVNEGCCGEGPYRAETMCYPMAQLCPNRKEYVFWDAYHPTEASNLYLANSMYTGGPKAVIPMNVQQLLALKALQLAQR